MWEKVQKNTHKPLTAIFSGEIILYISVLFEFLTRIYFFCKLPSPPQKKPIDIFYGSFSTHFLLISLYGVIPGDQYQAMWRRNSVLFSISLSIQGPHALTNLQSSKQVGKRLSPVLHAQPSLRLKGNTTQYCALQRRA